MNIEDPTSTTPPNQREEELQIPEDSIVSDEQPHSTPEMSQNSDEEVSSNESQMETSTSREELTRDHLPDNTAENQDSDC